MADRVQVMVRLRPFNDTERRHSNAEACVEANGTDEVSVAGGDRASRQHTYDRVFPPSATQEEVYDGIGGRTVATLLKGYNSTVLAYGQTGSGKTHSMLGPAGGNAVLSGGDSAALIASPARGLIPRLVSELFAQLAMLPATEVSWQVHCSVFELYRESINDLLGSGSNDFRIREDSGGRGVYVENLFAKPCTTAPEVLEALQYGLGRRHVAATKANETSSRSHTLTTISLTQTNHMRGETVTTSRLMLVDLAGSEKVGKTGAEGDRLKEAQMINLSLTLLGNVIYKLTDGKSKYIPYRDSKLTRLLQDSFGGNASTILLCHCSAAPYNLDETISTLLFASRAKKIRNRPRVNRDMTAVEMKQALLQAKEELAVLRDKLALLEEMRTISGAQPSTASNDVTEAGSAPKESAGAPTWREERAAMRLTIEGLLRQIEELRLEQLAIKDDLAIAKEQADFHRGRGDAAEAALHDRQSKHRIELQHNEEQLTEMGSALALERQKTASLAEEVDALRRQLASPLVSVAPATSSVDATASREDSQLTNAGATQRTTEATGRAAGSGARGARRISATAATRGGARQHVETDFMSGGAPTPSPVPSVSVLSVGSAAIAQTAGEQSPTRQRYNVELQLRIEALEREVAELKSDKQKLTSKVTDAASHISQLLDDLEAVRNERDTAARQLESKTAELEVSDRDRSNMKRILDALNIDVEQQLKLLEGERSRATQLASEADRLRGETDHLRGVQQQLEYAEMAAMELRFRGEDLDQMEEIVYKLVVSSTRTAFGATAAQPPELRSRLAQCKEDTERLDAGFRHVVDTLKDRKFATANLESQRLSLLGDAIGLSSRATELLRLLR